MLSPDLQRLLHIQEYCKNIQGFQHRFGSSFETFCSDLAFQQSVSFCILQIGELCSGLSEEYRKHTKEQVQWSAIKGMRNVVVHDYGNIKLELLWTTVIKDIPALMQFCDQQLADDE